MLEKENSQRGQRGEGGGTVENLSVLDDREIRHPIAQFRKERSKSVHQCVIGIQQLGKDLRRRPGSASVVEHQRQDYWQVPRFGVVRPPPLPDRDQVGQESKRHEPLLRTLVLHQQVHEGLAPGRPDAEQQIDLTQPMVLIDKTGRNQVQPRKVEILKNLSRQKRPKVRHRLFTAPKHRPHQMVVLLVTHSLL